METGRWWPEESFPRRCGGDPLWKPADGGPKKVFPAGAGVILIITGVGI